MHSFFFIFIYIFCNTEIQHKTCYCYFVAYRDSRHKFLKRNKQRLEEKANKKWKYILKAINNENY